MDDSEDEADGEHAQAHADEIRSLAGPLAQMPVKDAAEHRLFDNGRYHTGQEQQLEPLEPAAGGNLVNNRVAGQILRREFVARVPSPLQVRLHGHENHGQN